MPESYERQTFVPMCPSFVTSEQFIKEKVKMLQDHFRIKLTDADMEHLWSLETETEINAAVKTIINNHWE